MKGRERQLGKNLQGCHKEKRSRKEAFESPIELFDEDVSCLTRICPVLNESNRRCYKLELYWHQNVLSWTLFYSCG